MRRRVLADHVFDELLSRLMDGTLAAGSSLNIDALARDLDVSPTPVREALARLEATGMVHRVALRGYFVAPAPTAKELADLMDARLAVEPVNAFYACARGDGEFVAALERAVAELEASPNGPTYQEFRDYWEADERFHTLVAEAADNTYLQAAFAALGGLVQRFRQFSGTGVTDKDVAVAEHRAVLDAIRSGVPEQAQELMRRHIEGVRSRSLAERGEPAPSPGA
ncbi:transcriptional regulator, GntR family [Krasilnikoviella flava]|uniref:Transcriptional regulator, GntR family n=1 Tax=Krasilnikoviella flava TaxID=526729 RepID=A0A1T5J3H6_9MICO|nr:transcriptional regulator, GntR family [Krasilnikoviella flava]